MVYSYIGLICKTINKFFEIYLGILSLLSVIVLLNRRKKNTEMYWCLLFNWIHFWYLIILVASIEIYVCILLSESYQNQKISPDFKKDKTKMYFGTFWFLDSSKSALPPKTVFFKSVLIKRSWCASEVLQWDGKTLVIVKINM